MRRLDYAAACEAIAAARAEADSIGKPWRGPPVALEDCDQALIESALAAPFAAFGDCEVYPDLASKSAVLTYAFAKSQACLDGNKRVGLILLYSFLALNDACLDAGSDEVADRILNAASSLASRRREVVDELETWFRTAIVACGGEGIR